MNKKFLVLIGMAAVIALSGGAIAYMGGSVHERGSDAEPTEVYSVTESEADTEAQTEVEETQPQTEDPTDEVSHDENDSRGYKSVMTSKEFHVNRVVDHTDNSEYTPREIFGSIYTYCYLRFDSDGTFELCLNPALGEIRKGSYKIFDSVISAVYDDDGRGAEFDIIAASGGGIEYIVVNYGDYDVYFG